MSASAAPIQVNRAPVLTLWAAVVAQRLGFRRDEALTLGRAVAGLNAYSKGVRLGLFRPHERGAKKKRDAVPEGRRLTVDLLQRAVPCVRAARGVGALSHGKPIDPASVDRYLHSRFGGDAPRVRRAMESLARSISKSDLADRAYDLYARFRPEVPRGQRGWGARGALDLSLIRSAAHRIDREAAPP